jgi:quercetin dioxygenase-like cupin family protein
LTVARFPRPEKPLKRDWGHEVVLVVAPQKYSMKLITMHRGAKGGLQKHHLKDEAGIMTAGNMKVIYDDGSGRLLSRVVSVGDTFHFPAGAVHQAEALTDCAYIEVSTPHFNDRVHCEADYGIEKEDGGLPSTKLEEVELR